ncbi:hypothetical protein [Micromonospora pisi]|uniref:hypothetical protein n=1 Tax=Micromonospora pisi TaxID=589240 RepID=UPI0011C3FA42|nr:hypothetical protein [Micromonospora pisi]
MNELVFIDAVRRRWVWAAALFAVVALGIGYAGQVRADAPAAAPAYQAVDLADAILFADGPAARHLEGLERPSIEWTEEAKRSKEAIGEAISRDGKWGESFASRVQSGDPNQIAPALHDLGVKSRLALDDLWGRDTMDKAMEAAVGGSAVSTILAWQRYVVIYRIIVIVRHIYVVWSLRVDDRFATGNLPDEITIRTIAQNLSVR